MTAPNRATLFGRAIVDELARLDVAVAFAPGSRSTPLVTAACNHPDVTTFSHLDERCAAFFALGRGRRSGHPTAVVCTSGTAAANFHPAVMEADRGRVPLIAITADRPPELTDSGANQTADQEKLYGNAVRWERDLPEPEPDGRKLRSVRTTVGRAVSAATSPPAGPVHLNARFRKPLEPTELEGDVPDDFGETDPLAAGGRPDGSPYVTLSSGTTSASASAIDRVATAFADADRALIVAGPADPGTPALDALLDLSRTIGCPVLADPLSGLRFHGRADDAPVCGGYDAFLDPAVVADWPDPEVVLRVGASPTSKVLRKYLAGTGARQFVVDPAGGWREAEFAASDLVVADPGALAAALEDRLGVEDRVEPGWRDRVLDAEAAYWNHVGEERDRETHEGEVLATVAAETPGGSTVFVSNSMPVRDLDRFGRPRCSALAVVGNRGVSGIDGIVSTALGAGSVAEGETVLVTGDLALYHDMNGLLALGRLGVDATIVVVNNDGGGIFHELPIEEFDPPFTEAFRTPHGLDFSGTETLYDLAFERVEPNEFEDRYQTVVGTDGTTVLEVCFDAERSHRARDRIQSRVADRLE
jgi:2-succinyl-5-enolpyruvyl-6-hydroxy-3-cyclohexene-1-carboxylate synthase